MASLEKKHMSKMLALAVFFLALVAGPAAATGTTPTFFARRDYAGMEAANWVGVGDVNGDGIPDLVVNKPSWDVDVLFGNGDGTFRTGPTFVTGMLGSTFALADLNGDGKMDLVIAGVLNSSPSSPSGIGICFGNGDGTFQPAVTYPDMDTATPYLVLGDFNGDGVLDVVTVGSHGVWLFPGTGNGTFGTAIFTLVSHIGGTDVAAADFNKDGNLDLVVTTKTAVAVLFGKGNGTFQPPVRLQTPAQPSWIALGDINSDGYTDVALTMVSSNEVSVFLNNRAGGFSAPTPVYMPGGWHIAIGDVNGDGIPDLVNSFVYIAQGNGNGTFGKPVRQMIQGSDFGPYNVVLADLRNNGHTDLVVMGAVGVVSVLLNEGKGKYEDGFWTPVTGGAGCGVAADFNGDGAPDLAVNTLNGISILLGTGKANAPFKPGATIPVAYPDCVAGGDFNGDGIPDLLEPTSSPPGGSSPPTVLTYLGNGDGTFTLKSTLPIPITTLYTTAGYLAAGDLNRDGKMDFVSTVNLLALGNGDGTFQTPVTLDPNILPSTALTGFSSIAVQDLNGDGWPDIVATDYLHNYIYVLLNNQQGGFTQTVIQPTEYTAPLGIYFGRLIPGGAVDLIITLGYNGGMAIYLGDGQGGFAFKEAMASVDNTPGPAVAADLNGDGITDIAWSQAGTVAIYAGNGDGTFQTPFYIGAGPSPGDIRVEDLHGQKVTSRVPDLVLPDITGGVMTLINDTK
jgi:FG-GAP-like repeat